MCLYCRKPLRDEYNWGPAQVPTAADDVTISVSGTSAILIGSTNAACQSLTLSAPATGSPTLSLNVSAGISLTVGGLLRLLSDYGGGVDASIVRLRVRGILVAGDMLFWPAAAPRSSIST